MSANAITVMAHTSNDSEYLTAEYNGNRSKCSVKLLPTSSEFFSNLTVAEIVLVTLCGCITLGLILSFLEKMLYIMQKYQTNKLIRYKSIGLLGIYPVIALTSFIGLCYPRADIVVTFVQAMYIAHCLFVFFTMMVQYLDGPTGLTVRLKDQRINLRTPPCCCCCLCLKPVKVTSKSIMVLRLMTLQHVVIAPIVSFFSLVLYLDGQYRQGKFKADNAYPYLNTLNGVSALFAVYSYIVFFRFCKESLRLIKIVPKFITLQLVIVFVNVQNFIFDILASFNIPACERGLSASARGQAYNSMIIIFEMLLLSLIARKAYRFPHDQLDTLNDTITVVAPEKMPPAETNATSTKQGLEKEVQEKTKLNGSCAISVANDDTSTTEKDRLISENSKNSRRDSYISIDSIGKKSLSHCRESDV